jgi:hypothetical protein
VIADKGSASRAAPEELRSIALRSSVRGLIWDREKLVSPDAAYLFIRSVAGMMVTRISE